MSTYSVCLGLAFFVGWFCWTRVALKERWILSPFLSPAPVAAFFGILGAKALAAIGEWDRYGHTLFQWQGPLAVQGGMIASALCLWTWAVLWKRPVLPVLDAQARALAGMLIPIRLGCLAAGCCFGTPTDSALGIRGADGVLRHATPAYEIGLALLLLGLLHGRPICRVRPGRALGVFSLVYGAGRALLELFRDDTRPVLGDVSYPQLVALGMTALGAVLLLSPSPSPRSQPEPTVPGTH